MKGWPPGNPYIRDFAEAIRLKVVLAADLRLKLLGCAQLLLEQTLFTYAEQWFPSILTRKKWTVPECAELTEWWTVLRREMIPANSIAFPAGFDIGAPFCRLSNLRHAAVHRFETPVDILKRMMDDGMAIMGGFRDDLRKNKLAHIRRALEGNDTVLLNKVISSPVETLSTIIVALPLTASNAESTTFEEFGRLHANIARPLPARNARTMALSNLLPPPPPRRPPSIRRPINENLPPSSLHRRSRSPIADRPRAAASYRQRDEPVRRPNMRSSNRGRVESANFIDLTEDYDDDVTAQKTYIHLQPPANFIDLTMED